MSDTKFTQGEWARSGFSVSCKGSGHVAKALEIYMDKEERRANMHLISSAPDLYAALEAMVDLHISDFGVAGLDNSIVDKACAALAKARGEL